MLFLSYFQASAWSVEGYNEEYCRKKRSLTTLKWSGAFPSTSSAISLMPDVGRLIFKNPQSGFLKTDGRCISGLSAYATAEAGEPFVPSDWPEQALRYRPD
jgi:hypothetical protein